MTEQYDRDFKGVWIPKKVWLDDRLNMLEKGILAEIDSLDMTDSGCFASNKHIADFCQCSETKASLAISKLIEYGYLEMKSFDGRQRILKSRLSKYERQPFKNCKADFQNMKDSNTYNKTYNKTDSKERKKETYEAILAEVENEDLRNCFAEYVKMRMLIKAPMTDRALQMLITKVKTLEPKSVERQKALLEAAIINNWKSVYPLRDEPKKKENPRNPRAKTRSATTEELNDVYWDIVDAE